MGFKTRNRILMIMACLMCGWLLSDCATEEEIVRPQDLTEGIDLEFVGGRIELQNPLPRNGEEVEVMVIVRNRGNQDAKRVPVFFYDNLRPFSTEEINLEPGGQRRLNARWRATTGNHVISAAIDPAHHFGIVSKGRSEVSAAVLVR